MKHFTLEEARALLPQVRSLLETAMEARRAILVKQPELWPELERAAGNGHGAAAAVVAAEFQRLNQAVREIHALGVQLKDLETGLVDFPSRREGREVLLCWRLGEEDIAWWHDPEAGFAGRQPLED